MTNKLGILRFPLLASAFGLLLAGLWAGLLRIGWGMPHAKLDLVTAHGPLIVAGFLGTLISIERAVAVAFYLKSPLVRQLPYIAPIFSAGGAASLILGLEPSPAPLLITVSSAALVCVFTFIIFKQPVFYTVLMGYGALSWFIGNMQWYSGEPLFAVVPWWIAFLVLTIVAERLELARIGHISSKWWIIFAIFLGSFVIGILLKGQTVESSNRFMGLGEIGMALWLLRHDIARRTIRKTGLTRYIAACLLMGYVWLGISGGLTILYGDAIVGYRYDAILHTIFLGFAFSMIFAHAPIILPSILGVSLQYHPVFYVHFALLQLSLGLRVIGDIGLWLDLRRWGGLLNVVVILLFMGTAIWTVVRGQLMARRLESASSNRLALPIGVSLFGAGLMVIALVGLNDHMMADQTADPFDQGVPITVNGNPDTIVEGKRLFESYCAVCHGMDAHGLPGLGLDLIENDFIDDHSDDGLLSFIGRGRQPWEPDNTTGIAMPARGGNPNLTDADILKIIAYLRSSEP